MKRSQTMLHISQCALAIALVSGGEPANAAVATDQAPSPAQVQADAAGPPATDVLSSPSPTNDASGGEIVVTAQFREQRLQDTPLAITAMNGAALEARSQTSIVDVAQFAPNVNLSNAASFNGNALSAFIRGIGQEQSSFAFEPGVGIYIDDVYFGTTFGAVFDLGDLDRVEVLRGPQGTLAGKNSLGGAIKLFTRKPDGTSGGSIEATYGSYDRMEVRGSAGFTLADDLFARVSGVARHRRGFFKELDFGCVFPAGGSAVFVDADGVTRVRNPAVASGGIPASRASDNCVSGREGGGDLYALRASLRYAPTGSPLELNIAADVSRDDSEQVPTKLAVAANAVGSPVPLVRSYFQPDPAGGVPFDPRFITAPHSYTNYANYSEAGNFTTLFGTQYQVAPGTFSDGPKNTANSWGVSATVDYALGSNMNVKSITAYRKAWGTTVNDVDGTPLVLLKERLNSIHEQFTEELRLSGKIGDIADFTVGGFYYKANDFARFRIQIPIDLFDFVTNDPINNRSIAGFAHVEVHPTERLNLIGGLRYTDDKKTYTFRRLNPDLTPVGTIVPPGSPLPLNFLAVGLDGLSSTFKGDRLDYRFGANYRFNNELMIYAQIATGYKGGGINPQPFVPDQVDPFGPESLVTYEIGLKADLFDRAVRLNAAAFTSDYSDIQRTVFFCPESVSQQCGQTKNVADARYRGVELEAQLRPIHGLNMEGSIAYLDADYTDIIDASSLVTLDMRPPFTSKWQASASVDYTIDLGDFGQLTPRLDWSYLSSFFYNAVNNPFNRVDGRSLVNARLTYDSPDRMWSVSAAVTNLADKFYLVGVGENIANLGNSDSIVGRPREWSITAKRRF